MQQVPLFSSVLIHRFWHSFCPRTLPGKEMSCECKSLYLSRPRLSIYSCQVICSTVTECMPGTEAALVTQLQPATGSLNSQAGVTKGSAAEG